MRIPSIQPTLQTKRINTPNNIKSYSQPPIYDPFTHNPQFKGNNYKGALVGLGGGLTAGLIIIGGAAIAGIVVLPAILGGAAVVGSGVAGATLGHKIEQKIDEIKSKKSQ